MAGSNFNPMAAAGGQLGAGLGALFAGWDNPSDAAQPWMNKIPGMMDKYYSPYINAGNRALPGLENEYGRMINDPGSRLNEIGQGYHQSPGFQFALQQALQGAGHAAAAGGMAGSPQHEQQNMGLATNMANQDYNQWLSHALGMHGEGLQGSHNIYNTGSQAGMQMGQDMSSYLANQAKLAYEGANAQNQHEGGMWGNIMGGAGTLAGGMFF